MGHTTRKQEFMAPPVNPSLLTLSPETLIQILSYLPLREKVKLSSTCRQINHLTYSSPNIWANILFPKDDPKITDAVVETLVRKITRCDAVKGLRLDGVAVTEYGIFSLLDHFGHSLEHLELSFHWDASATLQEQPIARFAQHLEIFGLTMGHHQKFDNMPPTFKQYSNNNSDYFDQTHYLRDNLLRTDMDTFSKYFMRHGLPTLLDDPPLPHLTSVRILSHEPGRSTIDYIKKLRVLIVYLSGHDLAKGTDICPVDFHRQYCSVCHNERFYNEELQYPCWVCGNTPEESDLCDICAREQLCRGVNPGPVSSSGSPPHQCRKRLCKQCQVATRHTLPQCYACHRPLLRMCPTCSSRLACAQCRHYECGDEGCTFKLRKCVDCRTNQCGDCAKWTVCDRCRNRLCQKCVESNTEKAQIRCRDCGGCE